MSAYFVFVGALSMKNKTLVFSYNIKCLLGLKIKINIMLKLFIDNEFQNIDHAIYSILLNQQ